MPIFKKILKSQRGGKILIDQEGYLYNYLRETGIFTFPDQFTLVYPYIRCPRDSSNCLLNVDELLREDNGLGAVNIRHRGIMHSYIQHLTVTKYSTPLSPRSSSEQCARC